MGSLYFEKLMQPVLTELAERMICAREKIPGVKIKPAGYFQWDAAFSDDGSWMDFPVGDTWGGTDSHFCFRVTGSIPESFGGRPVSCRLSTGATDIWNYHNPQFLAFVNGSLICGLDVNHTEFDIPAAAVGAGPIDLGFFAYSNNGKKDAFFELEFIARDEAVAALYYDLKIPFDIAMTLHDDDDDWLFLSRILTRAANMLDFRERDGKEFRDSIESARRFLAESLYSNDALSTSPVVEHCVGHTHIDVAWLWTLDQTKEKVLRSFSSALYLMEKYPEFKFMSSQPILYEFVKEKAPDLYRKIRERVDEGRWEVEGSMWLEADCNLTSGESLVRQIAYGKKFFRDEFGKDNRVLWLPDVFGYSAAMPQIMRKSGIDYFMTTKIAWNDTNRISHDTMLWRGIDGTSVLTHFITTATFDKYELLAPRPNFSTTYNGTLTPKQVKGCWQRYQDKELNGEILQCFGNGDGGGGPTAEMLENARRMASGLPGCPVVKHSFVADFFRALEKSVSGAKKMPVWSGELYLEFHRGTYTTMARSKKLNRESEFALGSAELFSSLALCAPTGQAAFPYPSRDLSECWKIALLNQFHDILPGSAIKPVYDESERQYASLLGRAESMIDSALDSLASRVVGPNGHESESVIVFNQLGFPRTDIVRLPLNGSSARFFDGERELPSRLLPDGSLEFLAPDVPPNGYRSFSLGRVQNSGAVPPRAPTAAPRRLSTAWYDVAFDGDGCIVSLFDREQGREIVLAGQVANALQAFDDRPAEYDAWNIDPQLDERMWEIRDLSSFEVIQDDGLGIVLQQTRKFLSSSIEQDIVFYRHTRRIDFRTRVDWKESHVMLKVAFPVDVRSTRAAYEIQFGLVERDTHRNTSWDEARFETCAHKWADLSESGYGVSLMNDCKYGYDIRDSVMRLSLLRSPTWPNPEADRCQHEFSYALYPHGGNYRDSPVVGESFSLNCPLRARVQGLVVSDAILPRSLSLASIDRANVFFSAIKKAEDSNALVLRLYEAIGARTVATIELSPLVAEAFMVEECTLLEESIGSVACEGNRFSFVIMPFEIKTFRVSPRKP